MAFILISQDGHAPLGTEESPGQKKVEGLFLPHFVVLWGAFQEPLLMFYWLDYILYSPLDERMLENHMAASIKIGILIVRNERKFTFGGLTL